MRYTIYIDGGSRGNGTDSQEAYGSSRSFHGLFKLIDGRRVPDPRTVFGSHRGPETGWSPQRHYHFGNFTNNEAEYLVLLEVLKNVLAAAETGFFDKGDIVVIRSDSALVVNQVNHHWKVKDDGLKLLYHRVQSYCSSIYNANIIVSVEKAPRDEILSILGH